MKRVEKMKFNLKNESEHWIVKWKSTESKNKNVEIQHEDNVEEIFATILNEAEDAFDSCVARLQGRKNTVVKKVAKKMIECFERNKHKDYSTNHDEVQTPNNLVKWLTDELAELRGASDVENLRHEIIDSMCVLAMMYDATEYCADDVLQALKNGN